MVVGNYRCSLELEFSANTTVRLFATPHRRQLIRSPQAGYLRSSLQKLEGLLKDYSPLMNESTERALGRVIQYGAAFSEVSFPITNRARC
jgi:hypothetical protein